MKCNATHTAVLDLLKFTFVSIFLVLFSCDKPERGHIYLSKWETHQKSKHMEDNGCSPQLIMTIPDSWISWLILLGMILLDIWTLRIDTVPTAYCSP